MVLALPAIAAEGFFWPSVAARAIEGAGVGKELGCELPRAAGVQPKRAALEEMIGCERQQHLFLAAERYRPHATTVLRRSEVAAGRERPDAGRARFV